MLELPDIPIPQATDFCCSVYISDDRNRRDVLGWATAIFREEANSQELYRHAVKCLYDEVKSAGAIDVLVTKSFRIESQVKSDRQLEAWEMNTIAFTDNQSAKVIYAVWNNAMARMGYRLDQVGYTPDLSYAEREYKFTPDGLRTRQTIPAAVRQGEIERTRWLHIAKG